MMNINPKIKTWVAVLMATICISGCVINPWYFEKDLETVDAITGSWIPNTPNAKSWNIIPFAVFPEDKKAYLLDKGEGPNGLNILHFFKMDGQLYADQMDKSSYLENHQQQDSLQVKEEEYHNLIRIEINGSSLIATPLDLDYLENQIEKGIYKLPYKTVINTSGEMMLITASTKQLQKFLALHKDDTLLFNKSKAMTFSRSDEEGTNMDYRKEALQQELSKINVENIKTECESYDALLKSAKILIREVDMPNKSNTGLKNQWEKYVVRACGEKSDAILKKRKDLGFENHELQNCPSYDSLKIITATLPKPKWKEAKNQKAITKFPEIREDSDELIAVAPPMPGTKKNKTTEPSFPGSMKEMYEYIDENLHYPPLAKEQKIEGLVVLQFLVQTDGSITNIKLIKGIGGGCDEEAIRMVKEMPNWKPATQNGKAVPKDYKLHLMFKVQ